MVTITDGTVTRTLSCDQWALLNETPPTGFTVTANSCAASVAAFYSPFASFTLGDGTVVSVGLTMPASVFDVDGSPVTSSGILEVTLIAQNANKVWAGPVSGADALPVFRALVANDVPNLSALNGLLNLTQIAQGGATNGEVLTWNGTAWVAQAPTTGVTGSGTAGQIAYWSGANTLTGENDLWWDAVNNRLGVRTNSPTSTVDFRIAANTQGLAVNYEYFIGATAVPLAVINQDGLRTFAIGGNRTQSEGNIFISAPSVQGDGAGITFSSHVGATTRTGLFQLDNDGNMVFRHAAAGTGIYFDFQGAVFFRNAAFATQMHLNSTGLIVGGEGAVRRLHVVGAARITDSAGMPTAIMGRDANGDIANLALSGLSISGGQLTGMGGAIENTRVAYGTGTNAIGGEADFTYNAANNRLTVGTAGGTGTFNARYGAISSAEPFKAEGNVSVNMVASLINTFNASGAGNVIWQLLTGGANGGDPTIQFSVSGAITHALGLDNSDGDKVKITPNASLPGGNTNASFVVTNDSPPRYGFNVDAPGYVMDMNERARFGQVISRGITYAPQTGSTGAGTGSTILITNSSGNGFTLGITTGTTPTLGGNITTITIPWFSAGAVNAVFCAGNDLAAAHISRFKISATSNNNITFANCNTALAASSDYVLRVVFFG